MTESSIRGGKFHLVSKFSPVQCSNFIGCHPPADENFVPRGRVVILRARVENDIGWVNDFFPNLTLNVVAEVEVVLEISAVLDQPVSEYRLLFLL